MAEKAKRTGPKRKYPDAIYSLAYQMFRVQNMTAIETAKALNAKDLCERIDSTMVPYLAKIGNADAKQTSSCPFDEGKEGKA